MHGGGLEMSHVKLDNAHKPATRRFTHTISFPLPWRRNHNHRSCHL